MHMHMSFWFGPDLGEFLFKNFNINGAGPLAGVCIVLIVFSILFESMKVRDAKAKARVARERHRATSLASETANLLAVDLAPPQPPLLMRVMKAVLELFMFMSHNILGYLLMLAVMVYNGYVFIAVIVGMGIGYFIFGHISMKINMENIQARTTNVICSQKCTDSESTMPLNVDAGVNYNTLSNSSSGSPSTSTAGSSNHQIL